MGTIEDYSIRGLKRCQKKNKKIEAKKDHKKGPQ